MIYIIVMCDACAVLGTPTYYTVYLLNISPNLIVIVVLGLTYYYSQDHCLNAYIYISQLLMYTYQFYQLLQHQSWLLTCPICNMWPHLWTCCNNTLNYLLACPHHLAVLKVASYSDELAILEIWLYALYSCRTIIPYYTLSLHFLQVLLRLLIPCMIRISTSAMS